MKKILLAVVVVIALLLLIPVAILKLQPNRIISKQQAKQELSSPYSHFINWRGAEVHYVEEGTGQPLLLIHGFGGAYTNFSELAKLMKDHYRVISVDLPGFGLSDFPELQPNENFIQDYRDYMSFILDTLHLDSVYVVGNSMGGAVTWFTALDHPDKVKKAVLLDPAGYDAEKVAGGLAIFKFQSFQNLFDKGMPLMMSWGGIRKAYYKDDEIKEERVVRNNKFTNREGNLKHMLNLALSHQFPDTTLIQQVKVPTLIVWGKEDEIIPLEHAYRFKRDIKGSELIVFDRCGHCPMMEEPQKTKDAIEKFFAE